MSTLFSMSDDQIVAEAARITAERKEQADRHQAEEINRLYRKYATGRDKSPHGLGKPQRLEPMEALLLVALERNKFVVEAHLGGRWFGDAYCKHNLRAGAMASGTSRLDLLMGLWQIASGQTDDAVMLTEEHLNGSVVQADLRALHAEVREQDRRERARRWAWGYAL